VRRAEPDDDLAEARGVFGWGLIMIVTYECLAWWWLA